jgi:hypothetical protein
VNLSYPGVKPYALFCGAYGGLVSSWVDDQAGALSREEIYTGSQSILPQVQDFVEARFGHGRRFKRASRKKNYWSKIDRKLVQLTKMTEI